MASVPVFDHEKLDVYRLDLDFVKLAANWMKDLDNIKKPLKGEVLGQLDRSSLSSLLNTAEGNGKHQGRQQAKFFDMARPSEGRFDRLHGRHRGQRTNFSWPDFRWNKILLRVVSMLTRLVERFDGDGPPNRRWLDQQEKTIRQGLRVFEGSGTKSFGDRLALDGSGLTQDGTPQDLIGSAFFAHALDLGARVAAAIGQRGEPLWKQNRVRKSKEPSRKNSSPPPDASSPSPKRPQSWPSTSAYSPRP